MKPDLSPSRNYFGESGPAPESSLPASLEEVETLVDILLASPLGDSIRRQITEKHDANRRNHTVFDWAYINLYSLNPEHPRSRLSTKITFEKSPLGKERIAGIDQKVSQHYSSPSRFDIPETDIKVWFGKPHPNSLKSISTSVTQLLLDPRFGGKCQLKVDYTHRFNGNLSFRRYQYGTERPHIELNQWNLPADFIQLPEEIHIYFDKPHSIDDPGRLIPDGLLWVDSRLEDKKPHWPAMGKKPYSLESLASLAQYGLYLPEFMIINTKGDFQFPLKIAGPVDSVGINVVVPSRLNCVGVVCDIAYSTLCPGSTVSTDHSLFWPEDSHGQNIPIWRVPTDA